MHNPIFLYFLKLQGLIGAFNGLLLKLETDILSYLTDKTKYYIFLKKTVAETAIKIQNQTSKQRFLDRLTLGLIRRTKLNLNNEL